MRWPTCWRRTAEVVVTPGNPGIPGSVAVPPEEVDADLFVVGPEAPLVDGLADRAAGCRATRVRPGRRRGPAGGIQGVDEGPAGRRRACPPPAHGSFADEAAALGFLRTLPAPWVVKTDGLAAGKGVLVTGDRDEAEDDVRAKLSGESFGDAGRTVVIEEGLTGPELSVLAICDGTRAVPLAPAQDFKRVGDGDAGPNTGGMGAYSPVPVAGDDVVGDVMDRFVEPTLAELRRRGIDYRGVLYAGLMLTPEGPKLLEYNVRFGDPEAQVVLPRLHERPGRAAGRGRGRATCAGRLRPRSAPMPASPSCWRREGYPGDAPHAAT